jgi:hypothetical protein
MPIKFLCRKQTWLWKVQDNHDESGSTERTEAEYHLWRVGASVWNEQNYGRWTLTNVAGQICKELHHKEYDQWWTDVSAIAVSTNATTNDDIDNYSVSDGGNRVELNRGLWLMIIRFHLIFICRLFRIDSDVIIQYNAAYANKITDINYMSKAEDNSRIKVIVRFRPIN